MSPLTPMSPQLGVPTTAGPAGPVTPTAVPSPGAPTPSVQSQMKAVQSKLEQFLEDVVGAMGKPWLVRLYRGRIILPFVIGFILQYPIIEIPINQPV